MIKLYRLDANTSQRPLSLDAFESLPLSLQKQARNEKHQRSLYLLYHSVIESMKLSISEGRKLDFSLRYTEHGKSYFNKIPLYFNISHTKNEYFIAISDKEVGLDIEYLREKDFQAILERFFCKTEAEYIYSLPIHLQNQEFFRLWTLKEAYLKYKACGLGAPMKAFPIPITRSKKIILESSHQDRLFLYSEQFSHQLTASLCTPYCLDAFPKPKRLL